MAAIVHANAESALEDAATLQADYFVFDFRLPGISGVELLDRLNARADHPLNAVILTGELASDQFVAQAEKISTTLLFKPVEFAGLLRAWRKQRPAL